MWFNQASCDIYMGSGAGTKLLKEIGNAQKSVKICSPYLSPKMIDELVWLNQQGIEVALITSDKYDTRNQKLEDSIRPLIVQHRHFDGKADRIRKTWRITHNIFLLGSIVLAIPMVFLYLEFHQLKYTYALGTAFLFF